MMYEHRMWWAVLLIWALLLVASTAEDAFGRKQGAHTSIADAADNPHHHATKDDLIRSMHGAQKSDVSAQGNTSPSPRGWDFGKVAVVMADNRNPVDVDAGMAKDSDDYWSMSFTLNRHWACHHGYDFTYYRFTESHQVAHPVGSVTGAGPTSVASCRQEGLGWREPQYCKIAAVGDALFSGHYDTVVFLDTDLFVADSTVSLHDLVARYPPVRCCNYPSHPDPSKHTGKSVPCKPCGDGTDQELWAAFNWPFDESLPNSGFFIVRNKGRARDMLSAWWHSLETQHSGIFEQWSLWHLLKQGGWFNERVALMPLKAMTKKAWRESPVHHIESGSRRFRLREMRKALARINPKGCSRASAPVRSFNASERAAKLFPAKRGEGSVIEGDDAKPGADAEWWPPHIYQASASASKNAIVSFAFETPKHFKSTAPHYTPTSLAAFVRSARAHMPAADVDFVLFVHSSQLSGAQSLVAFAKQWSVTLIPIEHNLHQGTIETGRIPLLVEWLKKNHEKYAFVALSDARDVYFQADPFKGLRPGDVHIFEQETNVTFTSMGFSGQLERQWVQTAHRTVEACGMKHVLSDHVLSALADPNAGLGWHLDGKGAFTFGVLLGGMAAMTNAMVVVDRLWQAVDKCTKAGLPKVCQGCKRSNHGLDQGILNLMYYATNPKLSKGYKLVGHVKDRGMMTNVPCCPYTEPNENGKEYCRPYAEFLRDGRVSNVDGVVPIVHQHDRCPGLAFEMAQRDGFALAKPRPGAKPRCCGGA